MIRAQTRYVVFVHKQYYIDGAKKMICPDI